MALHNQMQSTKIELPAVALEPFAGHHPFMDDGLWPTLSSLAALMDDDA